MSETTMSIGDSLRLIAEWYDAHPNAPAPYVHIHINEWPKDTAAARLAAMAAALKPCRKELSSWRIGLQRQFGCLEFGASVSRDAICEKVVTYKCPESLLESLDTGEVEQLMAAGE